MCLEASANYPFQATEFPGSSILCGLVQTTQMGLILYRTGHSTIKTMLQFQQISQQYIEKTEHTDMMKHFNITL